MNPTDIIYILTHHPLIRLRHKAKRVFIIGSFATGTQQEHSDIDVLLEVRPVKGMTALELAAKYRDRLQRHFMRHGILGKDDSVHPQYQGRRLDLYFTYDASSDTLPKTQLK